MCVVGIETYQMLDVSVSSKLWNWRLNPWPKTLQISLNFENKNVERDFENTKMDLH